MSENYYMGMTRVASDITLEETYQGPGGAGGSSKTANFKDPVIQDMAQVLQAFGFKEGEDFTMADLKEAPTLAEVYPEYASEDFKVGDGDGFECCFTGVRYWYHPDYLGSVDMVTNGSGEVHQFFMRNPWGEDMYEYYPSNDGFNSPYRFNGKEQDEETGLHYYGARYYQNKLSIWLSVDPLMEKYPNYSPYVFTVNNPVNFVDPDGRWVPGIDAEGNVTYTAEEGDDLFTFMEQYGLTEEQVQAILFYHYVGEGFTVSGSKVAEVTGSEILKMDWDSEQATDTRRIDHILFAMQYENDRSQQFELSDFFQNIPDHHSGEEYGFGGSAFLKGYTSQITGEPLYLQVMIDQKTELPIGTRPSSNDNWYVPHQGYYYFRYNAQSGSSHPTVSMFLKFKGNSAMEAFTRMFDFEFSGIER